MKLLFQWVASECSLNVLKLTIFLPSNNGSTLGNLLQKGKFRSPLSPHTIWAETSFFNVTPAELQAFVLTKLKCIMVI